MPDQSSSFAPGWPIYDPRVGGLLATGAHAAARRVLRYLQVTQEHDGPWSQHMWLDSDRVDFTFYWPDAKRWEGGDFFVRIE